MNKEKFIQILKKYKQIGESVHRYYQFGIDLLEVSHSPIAPIDDIIQIIFRSIYSEEGIDWINWFMFENDFGDAKMEASDNGVSICQTYEELYDYIEQYKLNKNVN